MEKRANEMENFLRVTREIKVKTWHPKN